jgi:hypothetical protein
MAEWPGTKSDHFVPVSHLCESLDGQCSLNHASHAMLQKATTEIHYIPPLFEFKGPVTTADLQHDYIIITMHQELKFLDSISFKASQLNTSFLSPPSQKIKEC